MTLEFHDAIFGDLLREDGLAVVAPGLGVEAVVRRFVGFYSGQRHTLRSKQRSSATASVGTTSGRKHARSGGTDDDGAVLVLNASHLAERWKEALLGEGILPSSLPATITSEVSSAKERKDIYDTASSVFITSRICIVDLLTKRLDPEKIRGILVFNAHLVSDTSSEGFILRIFRQQNQRGFIKAFSDNPLALAGGFNKLEKVLRALHVRKLMLWPRFHVTVSKELEADPPEVVEISQPLSPGQRAIQRCVVEAMDVCIQELRKMVSIDLTELTVENNLFDSFDSRLRRLLDPLWNKLPQHAKQLVYDLRTLRELLFYLAHFDAISFYVYLHSVQKAGAHQNHPSPWLYTDAAEKLFSAARKRVYLINDGGTVLEEVLERNGKWEVLLEVLAEVRGHWKSLQTDKIYGSTVVIVCEDRVAAQHLSHLISVGPAKFLQDKWRQYLRRNWSRTELLRKLYYDEDREEPLYVSQDQILMWEATSKIGEVHDDDKSQASNSEWKHAADSLSRLNITVVSLDSDIELLKELRPTFIILYDPRPSFVRQIEVYKAEILRQNPLRVYFLLYEKSVEEHCYLAALRHEQAAFEKLIHTKAHMTIPAGAPEDSIRGSRQASDSNQDYGRNKGTASRRGHKDEEDMWNDMLVRATSGDSRKVRQRSTPVLNPNKILVDMREFRSKLPSLLHQAGLEIIPLTLDVGDYILSPDICVERKSVSDLFGSLASGRLITQGTAMTRNYKRPLLLIEWEPEKAFGLVSETAIPDDIVGHHIHSRLVQLIQTFPTLKLLWTRSPHATVELYSLLKERQREPDSVASVKYSIRGSEEPAECSDDEDTGYSDKAEFNRNLTAIDILHSLPGVNATNSSKIMGAVDSLAELCQLEKSTIENLIGKINGRELYTFLHHEAE